MLVGTSVVHAVNLSHLKNVLGGLSAYFFLILGTVVNAFAQFSDDYLRESQIANFLNRSVRQLRRWHEQRIGPPRITFQKVVLYRRSSFEKWLASHEFAPQQHDLQQRGRR